MAREDADEARPRIAIGGFLHETNTFAPSKATLVHFHEGGGWPGLAEGEAMLLGVEGVNIGVAGALDAARAAGLRIVPTLWTAAVPSAHVAREAFETILARLLAHLEAAGPLDGIFLDLHGAMVAEHVEDGEGEILARVRALIGPGVPLVAALDLHGNVSARMVEAADALVAFRTYPHVDMARTGERAIALLLRLIDGRPLAKAFRQIPFLIPTVWQCTDLEPARSIYAAIEEAEARDPAIASLSFLPGFPAADIPDCAPAILAYADDLASAERAADALAARVIAAEGAFAGEALSPEEAVARARSIAAREGGPVVIADTQDNPGAGGDSDTTGLLRALVAAGVERAAIGLIVDPRAAAAAHEAGVGAEIAIALGGASGIPGDAPFEGTFTVENLSDGVLVAGGAFYGGSRMKLGPSACLRIGGVRIAVASAKAQMADRAMFRYVGIEPEAMDVLVVKSSVHFRADFDPIARAILVAAAPGPMPIDPGALPFTRLAPGIRLSPHGPAFVPPAAREVQSP